MTKTKLKQTGERFIPAQHTDAPLYIEHMARYYFAAQFVGGKKVIDAGCGTGYGSKILKDVGGANSVLALDIDECTIDYAIENYPCEDIEYIVDSIEEFEKVGDRMFDVAVSFEVIEHIGKQKEFIDNIHSHLNPDGLFIVSSPNRKNYMPGNPFHVRELDHAEFNALLTAKFKYVKFYCQSFSFSSQIRDFPNINNSVTFDDVIELPRQYDPLYFIAICSNKELPDDIRHQSYSAYKIFNQDLKKGFEPPLSLRLFQKAVSWKQKIFGTRDR